MPDQYELWNEALVADYFPEGGRGTLAYLPVDDDELQAMALAHGLCDADQAVDDFVASVVAELAKKAGSFKQFSAWVNGWRHVRDHPPYIAGLALCVLAASRMEADPDAGTTAGNYYLQLNRLIGREEDKGIPPGFDDLPDVWRDLSRWLDDDCKGKRGASTVPALPSRPYIGFPLSQALLRACDRRRLPDFFRATGLDSDSDISPERLFVFLEDWSGHPSCGLTAAGRGAIRRAKDVDREEIAETVLRELRSWDGELRDDRGRRRAPLHLLIYQRMRGTSVKLISPRVDGFPESGWVNADTDEAVLIEEHASSAEWFAPLELTISDRVMEFGLRLTSGNFAMTFERAVAIPCRQAPVEVGGYISRSQAALWEPHLAIVNSGHRDRLLKYLTDHSVDQVVIHPSKSDLPQGWQITRPFRMSSVPTNPSKDFARLAPRLVAATSLDGGLRLQSSLYLTGGEPDAYIATEHGLGLEIELDGNVQSIGGGAVRLELSEMGLEAGPHQLKADVTRTFSTTDSLGDVTPPAAGSLGFPFSRHAGYRPESTEAVAIDGAVPRGTVVVSGASVNGDLGDLPLGDSRPYLLRAGARRHVLIGKSSDEVVVHRIGPPPDWLRQIGLDRKVQFVDVAASFVPAWALTEGSNGDLSVLEMEPMEPGSDFIQPNSEWVESVLEWRDGSVRGRTDAWLRFVSLAEALRGEVPDAGR